MFSMARRGLISGRALLASHKHVSEQPMTPYPHLLACSADHAHAHVVFQPSPLLRRIKCCAIPNRRPHQLETARDVYSLLLKCIGYAGVSKCQRMWFGRARIMIGRNIEIH